MNRSSIRGPIRPVITRTVGTLAAVALATLGALGVSGTAGATVPQDCKTVSAHITDRPDSGLAGNWALDTFDRTAKVCAVDKHDAPQAKVVEVQSWTYGLVGADAGAFTTKGVKSFQGHTMADGVPGKFSGSFSLLFEAPADWLGFTAPTNTNTLSTSEWIAHLWKDGYRPAEKKFVWGWKYEVCNETLINASTGNHGDITGLSRVPCYGNPSFTPKCDGSVVVLLTNAAPSGTSVAVYYVTGLPADFPHGKVNVPGGKPGQLSVTVTPVGGKVVVTWLDGREHKIKKYDFIMPKNCTSPTPTPSVSTSTPPVVGLPVTGADTTAAAIGGAVLVVAGVGIVLLLRRRRIRFEA